MRSRRPFGSRANRRRRSVDQCSNDPGTAELDRARRAIPHLDGRGASARIRALRSIGDVAAIVDRRHPGAEVRQVERQPRPLDRDPARRVKAQEPHPASALMAHVRPDVDLGERTGPWRGGQPARGDIGHPERDDAEVGAIVERVDLELGRDERPERLDRHRPVREQQVVPAHAHDPRTAARVHRGQPSGASSSPGSANAVPPRDAPATDIASR